MGATVYTTQILIGSSAKCYIDNANPTTPYAGSTRIEQEDFADASADTDAEFSRGDSQMDTDDGTISDHVSVGDVLVLKPSGGSLQTELSLAMSTDSDKINLERGYDGTADNGDIPTNADIYKSALNTCVTLCTFTIAEPSVHGITADAIVKDIQFDYNVTSHTGTVFVGLLKSDFSPTNATWNTSDGSSTWNPRFGGGSKGQEKIYKAFVSEGTGPTVSLKPFVEAYDLTWGSKVNLAIWHNATSAPTTSPATGFTVNTLGYEVQYEDPAPVTPVISITPNDDGLTWWDQRTGSRQTATIKLESGLEEDDIAKMYLTTNTTAGSSLDAYNDNSGPHLTTEEVGRREFSTGEMSNEGLSSDDDFSYYRMFVEDVNNTTTNATASNIVSAVKPEIDSAVTYNTSGAAATSFEIGDLVELRVTTDTAGDHGSGPAAGKINKVYVNWEASPRIKLSNMIYIYADMNDSQTTINVSNTEALHPYIYAAGTNEVYILLDTYSQTAGTPSLPLEDVEAIKITSHASGTGTSTTYNCTRAQLGTTAVAHESGAAYSDLYVYSPSDRMQTSTNIVSAEGIDNYVEYELPSPTSATEGSIRLTHRYDSDSLLMGQETTAGTDFRLPKSIRVVVEDEIGWRSDVFYPTPLTITATIPVARINASRGESAMASTAGDRETAVVLSGANSYSVGAGRTIK